MGSNILKISTVILSTLTFGLLVFLLILFYAYNFSSTSTSITVEGEIRASNDDQRGWKEYQTLKYDSIIDEYHFGISTLPLHQKNMEDNEFLFRKNKDSTYELISNIGDPEIMCTGICYCEDHDNGKRRSGSSSFMSSKSRKVVHYLLVAVSTFVAYDLAEKYFKEKCIDDLDEVCSDRQFIKSEVTECENVIPSAFSSSSSTPSEDSTSKSTPEKEKKEEQLTADFRFICTGTCLMKNAYINFFDAFWDVIDSDFYECFEDPDLVYKNLDDDLKETFGFVRNGILKFDSICNDLKLTKEVNFKVDIKEKRDVHFSENPVVERKVTERAYDMFLNDHLTPFCRTQSKISYNFGGSKRWNLMKKLYTELGEEKRCFDPKYFDVGKILEEEDYEKHVCDPLRVKFYNGCRRIDTVWDND